MAVRQHRSLDVPAGSGAAGQPPFPPGRHRRCSVCRAIRSLTQRETILGGHENLAVGLGPSIGRGVGFPRAAGSVIRRFTEKAMKRTYYLRQPPGTPPPSPELVAYMRYWEIRRMSPVRRFFALQVWRLSLDSAVYARLVRLAPRQQRRQVVRQYPAWLVRSLDIVGLVALVALRLALGSVLLGGAFSILRALLL